MIRTIVTIGWRLRALVAGIAIIDASKTGAPVSAVILVALLFISYLPTLGRLRSTRTNSHPSLAPY